MRHHRVQAVLFDVFGTLVDWRAGVTRALQAFAECRGLTIDAESLALQWRAKYRPAIEVVSSGEREYTLLDQLHLENLLEVFEENGIDTYHIPPASLTWLNQSWQRLDAWPDTVEGLRMFRQTFIVGALSNGNMSLLTQLARHAALPLDALVGSDIVRAYKPDPAAYLRAAQLLDISPESILLCAAHNYDLHAAQAVGYRTAFICRPTEYGTGQVSDLGPTGEWDITTSSVIDVALALGSESAVGPALSRVP